MKKYLLGLLLLVSCAQPKEQDTRLPELLDSIHHYDQVIIMDDYGDSATLLTRFVEDSIITNTYEINGDTITFIHNLKDTSSEEFIRLP